MDILSAVMEKAPLRPGGAEERSRETMSDRYYNPFWVGFTVVLSGIFVVLAFPIFARKMGIPLAFLATGFCLAIIWMRYIFVAWLVTRGKKGR
jgi:hypothetical protein